MAEEEKKIIIDEDWKARAQREKEELEKQQEQPAEREHGALPPADLTGLISMLAAQAFFALGLIRSEADKDKEIKPDLEIARYHIDMLAMLQDKCRGNLTDEEEKLFSSTLSQLRMAYVHLSK
jgi:hypothetical protein